MQSNCHLEPEVWRATVTVVPPAKAATDNAGLELCFDAISHGRLLFASSSDARYAFEEKVLILYADFRPILEEFNAAVIERIQP